MHTVSGRWQLGLALALTTAVCWGLLPIALKITLTGMEVVEVGGSRAEPAVMAEKPVDKDPT